jgi:hypothetical protein
MVLLAPDQGKPAARPGRKADGSVQINRRIDGRAAAGQTPRVDFRADEQKPQKRSFAAEKRKPGETTGRKATGLPRKIEMAAELPKRDDYEGVKP